MLPLPVAKLLDTASELFSNSPNTWPASKAPVSLLHHQEKSQTFALKTLLDYCSTWSRVLMKYTTIAVSFGKSLFSPGS